MLRRSATLGAALPPPGDAEYGGDDGREQDQKRDAPKPSGKPERVQCAIAEDNEGSADNREDSDDDLEPEVHSNVVATLASSHQAPNPIGQATTAVTRR